MLGLLVIDQDLEIIKVSFTVIAPWPSEDLVGIGVSALLLGHGLGDGTRGLERGDEGSGIRDQRGLWQMMQSGRTRADDRVSLRGEGEQESQSQAVLI